MQDWSSRALLLTWTLVGVGLYVIAPNLPFVALLVVGPLLVLAALAHIGFGLFLVGLFVVRHGGSWRRTWPLIASPVLAFAGLCLACLVSAQVLEGLDFAIRRPGYDAVVAKLERGERPSDRAPRYRAEGQPLRVAFPRDGLGDNWTGIVYDPTDQARTARGWRNGRPGDYTVAPGVRKWFGGDMVSCRHLTGHFYRCGFT